MFEDRINFLIELDKLKGVQRQTLLFDESRRENSAEHSWSLAMAVMLFADTANQKIDLAKAVKMALVHDVVEVYAGDTFVYDSVNSQDQFERELKALNDLLEPLKNRKFSEEIKSLWIEFEDEKSAESKYVKAIDRIFPLFQNWKTKGHSWVKHQISSEQVKERNGKIQKGSEKLWSLALSIIEESIQKGYLKK